MNPTTSISRAEAAQALGVRPAAVTGYLRRGHLRGVRLGRRWLIERSSVEHLLSEGTQKPQQ